ncbi:MAG: allophanate hydrolase subunit 1 [Flavobacteriaceae bacterium]
MSDLSKFEISALNTKTILLEWSIEPSDTLLEHIIKFKSLVEKDFKVERCVTGYKSLLIEITNKIKSLNYWEEHLKKLQKKIKNIIIKGNHWKIPICYDLKYAPDLLNLSKEINLDTSAVIKLHLSARYRINFLGFLPGFLYLSGLDSRLHLQRKKKPLLKVPKGAVAIGGMQTGIYPNISPGGWHLIGNTPVNLFNPKKNPPCFAKPGDWISFEQIDSHTYAKIESEQQNGNNQLNKYD